MTSEERLVAQVAIALLTANTSISPAAQIAAESDSVALKLPAIVVSAKLEEDQAAAAIAKRYTLTVELRTINKEGDTSTVDNLFAQVRDTLCPDLSAAVSSPPTVLTANFRYYRIENQSGSGYERGGDTSVHSRTFNVFARLL
jgi:hypothetical protein